MRSLRFVASAILVGGGLLVTGLAVMSVPDLKRYVRMHRM
jgi:hypothetical protein